MTTDTTEYRTNAKAKGENCVDNENGINLIDFDDSGDIDYDSWKEERRNHPPTLAEKCAEFLENWPFRRLSDFFREYIGGQDEAIQSFAMALLEHLALAANPHMELKKRNCLIYGPTGSGKTELLRVAAMIVPVPVVIEDASSITPTGFRGTNKADILAEIFDKYGDDARYAIVFLDEFDKLCQCGDETVDAFHRASQRDLLKMIEGETVARPKRSTYRFIDAGPSEMCTDNMMFVCGGVFEGAFEEAPKVRRAIGFTADFSDSENSCARGRRGDTDNAPADVNAVISSLIKYGMIAELAGRINCVVRIRPLTEEALFSILSDKKRSALDNIRLTFRATYGVELSFTEEALRSACRKAFRRRLGARGLAAILDAAAHQALLTAPDADTLVVNDGY
jgi:ATP-dependent Clp protease ATP-binding subunit ClpX